MKLTRKKGATSQILEVFIQDSASTTGAGKTGLAHDTASLTAYYHRNTAAAAVAISLVDMTVGTFTSSGFKEVDSTNMPGVYQLCVPNAAFLTGADSFSVVLKGATDMAPLPLEVQLAGTDLDSIVADIWNYATASAGAVTTVLGYLLQQLGLLFNGADVVLQAPVLASGDAEIVRGDDYLSADGRALLWSSDDWTPLDLSTAQSVTFRATTRYSTVFSKTLTVVSDTQIRLELETAETAAFAIGTNAYRFDISAVLFNDSIVTLVRGQMTVLEDVR